ncbi:MAG: response regulator [Synergistaceae bacterium]|jgi:signal transduction histidine kinase/ligand-binding sensor domain-containing protein/CheY-like chemotaxis protein|nr:response regulator [Synergistaceae bacterium]
MKKFALFSCLRISCLRILICLTLTLLFAMPAAGESHREFLSRYSQARFADLGQISLSSARKILQTKDGYIWIASYNGLIRFDGRNTRIYEKSSDTFPSNNITTLCETRDGTLWAGTNDAGVALLQKGQLKLFDTGSGLPSNSVRAVREDREGNVYVATVSGIVRFDTDLQIVPITFGEKEPLQIVDMDVSPTNELWCALSDGGLIAAKKEAVTRKFPSRTLVGLSICAIYCAEDGSVYAGSAGGSVVRFDPASLEGPAMGNPKIINAKSNVKINSFFADNSGKIWVCMDAGTGYIENGEFHPVDGLLLNGPIESMTEDHEGNLWFTSSRTGVALASKTRFKNEFFTAGLSEETVNAVTRLADRLYIGTDHGLVIIDESGERIENDLTKKLAGMRVRSLLADNSENLWICTYQGIGLLRFREGSDMTVLTEQEGLPGSRLRALYPSVDGGVLVCSAEGIALISGDRRPEFDQMPDQLAQMDYKVIRTWQKEDGLTYPVILNILQTPDGTIYAGSDGGGIYEIRDDRIFNINEKDGLSSGIILRMTFDGDYSGIWISSGNGIAFASLDGDKNTSSGLKIHRIDKLGRYADNVFAMRLAPPDKIWLIGSSGIYICSRSSLLSDKPLDIDCIQDGTAFHVTANSWSYLTDAGKLYIPCTEGLYSIEDTNVYTVHPKPKLAVNSISLDDRILENPGSTVMVPSDVHKITVDVAVLSYSSPMSNSITAYLEGFDRKLVRLDRERGSSLSYTNLRGGEYLLHLNGFSKDGGKSDELVIRIVKERGFMETPEPWLLAALLGAGLCIMIAKLYNGAKMVRQNKLIKAVNEAASLLLADSEGGNAVTMEQALGLLAASVGADAASLWRFFGEEDAKNAELIVEWQRSDLKEDSVKRSSRCVPQGAFIPSWREKQDAAPPILTVIAGAIAPSAGILPDDVFAGANSITAIPLTIQGEFWGFVCFANYRNTRTCSRAQKNILASGGLLLASSAVRGDTMKNLIQAKETALAGTKAKSDFLSRMSHEIRTPMNAIMGFSELVLREELTPTVYNHAVSIRQAGSNLLAIVNDILDLSRIESGRFEIQFSPYYLSSVINDAVSMVRTRLTEESIRFVVYVDPELPYKLLGDETRIRQVLVNILMNAVKYTKKGFVALSVEGRQKNDEIITLIMTVADSGIGIKPEDQKKLFSAFTRVNTAETAGIEGTGLGLAITKNLCEMMGGTLSFESEYGRGSTFVISIPQTLNGTEKIASVHSPEHRAALVFEARELCGEYIQRSFKSLGIPCVWVKDERSFTKEIENPSLPYSHVFLWQAILERALSLMDKYGLRAIPIAMANYEVESISSTVATLPTPIHSISIANAMNGEISAMHRHRLDFQDAARFTAPEARILVVDDVAANLTVARGLLAPFEMQIDCCSNGPEALKMVRKHRYDLVLMDHMMPGMDGVETAKQIRSMDDRDPFYRELPIIALTANAVVGMREMFLENGMDDYISKPIESRKLYELMNKWIPREKRKISDTIPEMAENSEEDAVLAELDAISDLDVADAVSLMGSAASYLSTLRQIQDDLKTLTTEIRDLAEKAEWKDYGIKAHAAKGILATIGAKKLAEKASVLEKAAKNGDYETCGKNTDELCEKMLDLSEAMLKTSLMEGVEPSVARQRTDAATLSEAVRRLAEACDSGNLDRVRDAAKNLAALGYDDETDAMLNEIAELADSFDFEEASTLCARLLELLDGVRQDTAK